MRAIFCALLLCTLSCATQAGENVWRFDNPQRIGGFNTKIEGHPKAVTTPVGKGLQFDGVQDSVFIEGRPLVGAKTFTIEAIIRPEGGAFEQRFMHIAETDPVSGLDSVPAGTDDPTPRFMFELRVVEGQWYLDAFVNSKSGTQPLMVAEKLHPLNRWYAVAQTYDGETFRSYVDGVLQGEAKVAFTPHGLGHVRVGARMNQISFFKGSIAQARFTDRALAPTELLTLTKK